MPWLCCMSQWNARLTSLRRHKASSSGAAAAIPAAVEAWVREIPLPVVLEALHRGAPRSVHRGVVPRVASATRGPAWIVDATGAIDLIDRRLVRYVKTRAWGVGGEAGDGSDSATLVIDGNRCRDMPLCIVAHKSADAIIKKIRAITNAQWN